VFGRQVFGGQFEVRLIEVERPYDVIEPFGKLGGKWLCFSFMFQGCREFFLEFIIDNWIPSERELTRHLQRLNGRGRIRPDHHWVDPCQQDNEEGENARSSDLRAPART
jgi:hypothetical protein